MYSSSIEQESGYFTQELSLDIDYWSHFVFTSITFEILFTKILDFFNMWVFLRTGTNFAYLASFQAIEFVENAGHFCISDKWKKVFYKKCSIL